MQSTSTSHHANDLDRASECRLGSFEEETMIPEPSLLESPSASTLAFVRQFARCYQAVSSASTPMPGFVAN
ncbi:MAG: hypothetical protein NC336_06430 [Clostridium sp.]|nr:hypothetical protein [Clostridium sp.]